MSEPEILDPVPRPQPRPDGERTLMHVLYAMHTLSWISVGVLTVIALVVNFLRREDTRYPDYAAHHNYMIRTSLWTLLWLAITWPLFLLFIMPGLIAWGIVGLWYLYRCLRGWLRFADGRLP